VAAIVIEVGGIAKVSERLSSHSTGEIRFVETHLVRLGAWMSILRLLFGERVVERLFSVSKKAWEPKVSLLSLVNIWRIYHTLGRLGPLLAGVSHIA